MPSKVHANGTSLSKTFIPCSSHSLSKRATTDWLQTQRMGLHLHKLFSSISQVSKPVDQREPPRSSVFCELVKILQITAEPRCCQISSAWCEKDSLTWLMVDRTQRGMGCRWSREVDAVHGYCYLGNSGQIHLGLYAMPNARVQGLPIIRPRKHVSLVVEIELVMGCSLVSEIFLARSIECQITILEPTSAGGPIDVSLLHGLVRCIGLDLVIDCWRRCPVGNDA
jgi:hypothetical protein